MMMMMSKLIDKITLVDFDDYHYFALFGLCLQLLEETISYCSDELTSQTYH
jgi:hypothetical protein